jgi:hypothetical protein
VETVADAEFGGGGEVSDREDAFRVSAGDLDKVGQRAADWCGVKDQVDRTVADGADAFDWSAIRFE